MPGMIKNVDVMIAQGLLTAMVKRAKQACEDAEQAIEAESAARIRVISELLPHLERVRPLGLWQDDDGLLERMKALVERLPELDQLFPAAPETTPDVDN